MYNIGEIRLFNTGWEGDPLIAQSGFTELPHKEPIAQVLTITVNKFW